MPDISGDIGELFASGLEGLGVERGDLKFPVELKVRVDASVRSEEGVS